MLSPNRTYKMRVIFAVGGTGGHLFPAQSLAERVQKSKPEIEVLFAGAKLSTTFYFDKNRFPFWDVTSTTPFRGNILKQFKSIGILIKGIFESLFLLSKKKPDLVIGFGSFHSFPVICAAVIKKIPLVLFEANAVPGKVIKLFSKKAMITAIYFEEAKQDLKGKTVEVEIPNKNLQAQREIAQAEARHRLSLELDLMTLLVFGGSQGAKQINQHLLELLPQLGKQTRFQLIHLTGDEEITRESQLLCETLKIPCYVKTFEKEMAFVWSAADIAICRSGAITLSEILFFEVPAILIPYPFSSDQHQLKNALFLEKKVGGAIHVLQDRVSTALLFEKILSFISLSFSERLKMKNGIKDFKVQQKKESLERLIIKILEQNESIKKQT
jgi:UDP-N-acetylglucosamine--N-acetylmuramyl-(pentapeptide) pyrophosphoryl-undecaprenol N-acetylglucosamine transferase